MSSKLKYHKDYTEFGETYQLVLPLNLEGLISEDESVRLLSHELEELDYTLLYQAYSSRKIETACRRDINFMWLLAGNKAPDHSTIARFRTGFLAEACANKYTFVWKSLSANGRKRCSCVCRMFCRCLTVNI